jgi:murein DD-endopeptidase MepM/ murein hydrolase activator NlpD
MISSIIKFLTAIFSSKTIIITSDKKTSFFSISKRVQIFLFIFTTVTYIYFIRNIIRYSDKYNIKKIVVENYKLNDQNNKLLNQIKDVKEELDKFYYYFNDIESTFGKEIDIYDQKRKQKPKNNKQLEESLQKTVSSLNNTLNKIETKYAAVLKEFNFLDKKNPINQNKNTEQKIASLIHYKSLLNLAPVGLPGKSIYVTSRYGNRIHPIRHFSIFHKGIDLLVQDGKITATHDGKVVFAGQKGGFGNIVEIENYTNGHKILTRYAHLSKIKVATGSKVKAGTLIGMQGSTGSATASHLHYEILLNGVAINPASLLFFEQNNPNIQLAYGNK